MYYSPLINEEEEVEINLSSVEETSVKKEKTSVKEEKRNCIYFFISLFQYKKYSG